MKKELARTLTVALSHFIDENRQGGMCASSGECEAMEKAFIAEDFDMIGEYVEKKLCGEDERIRKWIVTFIEVRLPDAAEFEPQYRAALAYLEKQKEQEWSDEDEEMRYFVAEAVQFRYSDREISKYLNPKIINEKKQLKQKLFDWLRRIRPSWKPSEELLEALHTAAYLHEMESYGGLKYKLRKLDEQLMAQKEND